MTLAEAMTACDCCGELGARRWRGTIMCNECIEDITFDLGVEAGRR